MGLIDELDQHLSELARVQEQIMFPRSVFVLDGKKPIMLND